MTATEDLGPLMRASALAALAALAVIAVVALLTHVITGGAARPLATNIDGIPNHAGEAVAILTHNALQALPVITASAVLDGIRVYRPDHSGPPLLMRAMLDGAVVVIVAKNLLVLGVVLGIYTTSGAIAMLPHGPIELAGFALVVGLYANARRRRVAAVQWVTGLGGTAVLLAVAAAVETYFA
jgi:hypothetical protein